MDKARAIDLLGGIRATADAIGITTEAVRKWPDPIPKRIADRVHWALARKRLNAKVLAKVTQDNVAEQG